MGETASMYHVVYRISIITVMKYLISELGLFDRALALSRKTSARSDTCSYCQKGEGIIGEKKKEEVCPKKGGSSTDSAVLRLMFMM